MLLKIGHFYFALTASPALHGVNRLTENSIILPQKDKDLL